VIFRFDFFKSFMQSSQLKIIVNADDLGFNPYVNRSIAEFIEKGFVSSVSLMANGEDFTGAVEIVRNYPMVSVGAHLNVTEFSSLSESNVFKEYKITDSENRFTGIIKKRTNIKAVFPDRLKEAIFQEWCLQVERILDNGIKITHIDSHNMVHYWKPLFPIIKKIQHRYSIGIVRMKDVKPISFYGLFNKNLPRITPPLLTEFSNLIWNLKMKVFLPKTIIVNHVFSYNSLCFYLSTGSKLSKNGIIEVVVHPGCDYMNYFKKENILVEEEMLKMLIPDYKMISFADLS